MSNYAIIKSGTVVNIVEWDGVTEWEPGEGVSAIKVKNGVSVEIGYTYDGSKFIAPPEPEPTHDELVLESTQTKEQLRATADSTIEPLADAVELGIATDEEIASLKAWKTYRVLLNRVDPNDAQNITWPDVPN